MSQNRMRVPAGTSPNNNEVDMKSLNEQWQQKKDLLSSLFQERTDLEEKVTQAKDKAEKRNLRKLTEDNNTSIINVTLLIHDIEKSINERCNQKPTTRPTGPPGLDKLMAAQIGAGNFTVSSTALKKLEFAKAKKLKELRREFEEDNRELYLKVNQLKKKLLDGDGDEDDLKSQLAQRESELEDLAKTYARKVKEAVEDFDMDKQELEILAEEKAEQLLDQGDIAAVTKFDQEHPDVMGGRMDNPYASFGQQYQPINYQLPQYFPAPPPLICMNPGISGPANAPPRPPLLNVPAHATHRNQMGSPAQQQVLTQPVNQPTQTLNKDGMMLSVLASTLQVLQRKEHRLPEFGGDPAQWSAFYNSFERTKSLHDSGVDMRRLQGALKGHAKQAVEHLFANDRNVPKIMAILQRRYGRPEMVLDHLIEKARTCKAPDLTKPLTMVDFGTLVESIVCNIEAYGRMEYLYNPLLVNELVQKLPLQMKDSWYKYLMTGRQATMAEFGGWLDYHVTAAQYSLTAADYLQEEKTNDRKGKKSGCVIAAAVEDGKETRSKACFICEKPNHYAYDCKTFQSKSVEDRWTSVKQKGLCFNCLSKGHLTKDCKRKKCGEADCTKPHHKLLHRSYKEGKPDEKKRKQKKRTKSDNDSPSEPDDDDDVADDDKELLTRLQKLGHAKADADKKPKVIAVASGGGNLPVIPVVVEGPNGKEKVYAMLDCCASVSLINMDLAERIGLSGPRVPLTLSVFGKASKTEVNSKTVELSVAGSFRGATQHEMKGVRTVKDIGIPGSSLNVDLLKQQHPHLQGVQMKNLNNAVPKMVIGFNYFKLYRPRKSIEDLRKDTPCAYRGLLGWYISTGGSDNESIQYLGQHIDDDCLHRQMKEFFSTENFGVKFTNESSRSKEDKRAEKILKATTVKDGDRYKTGLLWKEDDPVLPKSRQMAMKRLQSMERKMDRDPDFAKMTQGKFNEYISKGFLRRRTTLIKDETRRWYLPWFFAFHPTKNPRLVFDAAAKSHGRSLNDFLLKGPDLLNSLPAVLMRFRMHHVALMADVKEMFHQVKLIDEDKPAQTILYRGMERNNPPDEYEMQVLFFGSASSPCSAIYSKDVNAAKFAEAYSKAVKTIHRDFYMDDNLTGAETDQETIQLFQEVKAINDCGGFPLLKWSSSSDAVLQAIPEELRAKREVKLGQKEEEVAEKTLGLYWIPKDDRFVFKLCMAKYDDILVKRVTPTKRSLLGVTMSLFDPLGFVAPLKVKAMILLQKIWKSGIGWDDEIPSELLGPWENWLDELQRVAELRIRRRYCEKSIRKANHIQLHTFCDASEEAFAAVSYLRVEVGEDIFVSFVAGKVRVAPLRGLTIPRMELQAALMGTRLQLAILKAFGEDLHVEKSYFWSDSRTVLCWLRSVSGRFNPFIANRVGEIMETTNVEDWHWVPTKENVADDATRLSLPFDPSENNRWINGPIFLQKKVENFPQENRKKTAAEVNPSEMEMREAICVVVNSSKVGESLLPEIRRFSSWKKLIHATAHVLLATRLFKDKGEPRRLTVADISWAKEMWIKKSQSETFPDELKALIKGEPVLKTSSLYKLNPLLKNGMIILSGRITGAALPEGVKNPAILDPSNDYTKLMIDWYHSSCQHQGQELIINELRKEAWIISCRSAVRRVKHACLTCRKREAMPEIPMMGQLPSSRLEGGTKPFHYTGVDYFGPYELRTRRKTRSAVLEKRWGVLFTCLTTRAVHLELAESLDTPDMIKVLTRFINRRGAPAQIWSDHGTNFIGANRELKENLERWEKDDIANAMLCRGIDWHFVGPASPHMGGSWEAQIKCVKRILTSLLKEQHPLEGDMMTLFTEVEYILNNRPITRASPDPDDLMPLTPNHLLNVACVVGATIPGVYDEKEVFRKSWRFVQRTAQDFWKRWSTEYLPWLAKRNKWIDKSKPLEVGDIVIVLEDNAPRNAWKMGRVTRIYKAKDGQVRKVDVSISHVDPKDPKKIVKTSELTRPAVKICPLRL